MELKVQTAGSKSALLQFTGTTSSSFTVQAVFPTDFAWGNKLAYYNWDTRTWDDITGYGDTNAKSGTYTVDELVPRDRYIVLLKYYNSFTGEWTELREEIQVDLPPEKLVSYTRSDRYCI